MSDVSRLSFPTRSTPGGANPNEEASATGKQASATYGLKSMRQRGAFGPDAREFLDRRRDVDLCE